MNIATTDHVLPSPYVGIAHKNVCKTAPTNAHTTTSSTPRAKPANKPSAAPATADAAKPDKKRGTSSSCSTTGGA